MRTQRLNLDLGVVVSQLRTTTNFDNGYYDPRRYQYYAVTAYPYWKVSETIGAGLSLALGVQRDDFSPRFRFGGNASGELTFGIFSPVGAQSDRRRNPQPAARIAGRFAATALAFLSFDGSSLVSKDQEYIEQCAY